MSAPRGRKPQNLDGPCDRGPACIHHHHCACCGFGTRTPAAWWEHYEQHSRAERDEALNSYLERNGIGQRPE